MARYPCKICNCDPALKAEIEGRIVQKEPYRHIAKDCLEKFSGTLHALESSIGKHAKKHLSKENEKTLPLREDVVKEVYAKLVEGKTLSFSEFYDLVYKLAVANIISKPGQIKARDVFQAEALKIEHQREVRQLTGMKLVLAHLFSGVPYICSHCGKNMLEGAKITEWLEGEEIEKYYRSLPSQTTEATEEGEEEILEGEVEEKEEKIEGE